MKFFEIQFHFFISKSSEIVDGISLKLAAVLASWTTAGRPMFTAIGWNLSQKRRKNRCFSESIVCEERHCLQSLSKVRSTRRETIAVDSQTEGCSLLSRSFPGKKTGIDKKNFRVFLS